MIVINELQECVLICQDDGDRLYERIVEELQKKDSITLDFKGAGPFASPFFNASIGQLVQEIGKDRFEEVIKIEGLPDLGKNICSRAVELAEQVRIDPKYKNRLEKALADVYNDGF